MGLWKFRVKRRPPRHTDEQRCFVVECARRGLTRRATMVLFRERFGRDINLRVMHKILDKAGLIKWRMPPRDQSLESRKARVIAERGGLAPKRLDDPAAYRQAVRRSKCGKSSSSRRVHPPSSE